MPFSGRLGGWLMQRRIALATESIRLAVAAAFLLAAGFAAADVPVPEAVYQPEKSNEAKEEHRLRDPWSPEDAKADPSPDLPDKDSTSAVDPTRHVEQGAAQAGDLTADGRIRAGQIIEEVRYQRCQYVKGYSLVLAETGGCEVQEFYWNCETVKELWWVRTPKLLMSISTRRGREGYRRILICPNGFWRPLPGIRESGKPDSKYDQEPPVSTPGLPPIWLPPMQEPATAPVNESAGSVIGPDPDTVDTTKFYWRTVLPVKINGCSATYNQKLYKRVTRLNTKTGEERVISDAPAAPPAERAEVRSVPGCG